MSAILDLWLRGLYGEVATSKSSALEPDLRQFGPDHPSVACAPFENWHPRGSWGIMPQRGSQIELARSRLCSSSGRDHPTVGVRPFDPAGQHPEDLGAARGSVARRSSKH